MVSADGFNMPGFFGSFAGVEAPLDRGFSVRNNRFSQQSYPQT